MIFISQTLSYSTWINNPRELNIEWKLDTVLDSFTSQWKAAFIPLTIPFCLPLSHNAKFPISLQHRRIVSTSYFAVFAARLGDKNVA